MSASRKLAAILAADVVGYSRMMGEDEAGTAKAVRERREAAAPIIATHGGRLFKTMGDGMLIEFPSVVAAVECALAMQKQMAERNAETAGSNDIVYRIGVHLGDVLVDGDDVLGDGVNIAARLEGVAEPGGVCISGSAYDHVRGRVEVEFVDLGEKTLKNIARPLRVFAARVGPSNVGRSALAPLPATSPAASIAVLPFANMSGDPEQEYFADGISEDIITALSKLSQLMVIARNSSFTFKGKNVDLREVGKTSRRPPPARGERAEVGLAHPDHRPAYRRDDRRPRVGGTLRSQPDRYFRRAGRRDGAHRLGAFGQSHLGRASAHGDRARRQSGSL